MPKPEDLAQIRRSIAHTDNQKRRHNLRQPQKTGHLERRPEMHPRVPEEHRYRQSRLGTTTVTDDDLELVADMLGP